MKTRHERVVNVMVDEIKQFLDVEDRDLCWTSASK
jgi:hypothetical protein